MRRIVTRRASFFRHRLHWTASLGRGCEQPVGRYQSKQSMNPPSLDDVERLYPSEEWNRDLDFWFSQGKLSPTDYPQVVAYYRKVQAENPAREENCSRMWMVLAFIQSFLADLVQGGAVRVISGEKTILPPALVTALYRAFMSPVAASNPRAITVPLILQVFKQQKDWNEDRK